MPGSVFIFYCVSFLVFDNIKPDGLIPIQCFAFVAAFFGYLLYIVQAKEVFIHINTSTITEHVV